MTAPRRLAVPDTDSALTVVIAAGVRAALHVGKLPPAQAARRHALA